MHTSSTRDQAERAKQAGFVLRKTSPSQKKKVLVDFAERIRSAALALMDANQQDLMAAEKAGKNQAFLDRLALSEKRITALADGIASVAELTDPVGEILEESTRSDGLLISRVRVPLGVIAMIFEARPGVAADAAALCFLAGNACILRSGKEALHSCLLLTSLFRQSLELYELPVDAVQLIQNPDHSVVKELVQLQGLIDLVIPRGGESLIQMVVEHARVPVLKHYKGVCHAYVEKTADLKMAEDIIINGKCQRPGVCNALETLLVEREIAGRFLPQLARSLFSKGVEIRGDQDVCALVPQARPATSEDWDTEYLDLILSIRIVDSTDDAIAHISRHASGHSEVIISQDAKAQEKFLLEVDSSAVFVNASTRLSDGGELGLGAEIGISTDKLHARGPMGVRELTTYQWRVLGKGHIRS